MIVRRLPLCGMVALCLVFTATACSSKRAIATPSTRPQPSAIPSSPSPTPSLSLSPAPSPTPTHSQSTRPRPRRTSHPSAAICRGASSPSRWDHVIWIWMENHSYGQVVGYSGAPYENSLISKCGLATNYHGVTHPSLPNYMAATGGSTAGITSDCSPSECDSTGSSIFEQVSTWRSYEESMPTNCAQSTSGQYAPKHNPAAYYTRIRTECANWDVPFGTPSSGRFVADLDAGRLPVFSFITPNLCNDTHDCSIPTGDDWLRSVVGRITGSTTYREGRTAVFITWDEGYDSANHVATIVVAPTVHPGRRSSTSYDHYSLLRTAEEMLRVPLLGNAQYAASMRSAFGL